MAEIVLVTGASGLVGQALTKELLRHGYRVHTLGRAAKPMPQVNSFVWNPQQKQMDERALEGVSHIINLAGASIADGKWTAQRKKLILDSRVRAIECLSACVEKNKHDIKSLVSASAVGYYGQGMGTKVFDEKDLYAPDFLGRTCKAWEDAVDEFYGHSRKVKVRIGVVLSKNGGALAKMAQPVRFGVGAALGSGKQAMPWVHIHDLVRIFIQAIQDEKMVGAFNAAAPEQINNENFMKALAKSLHRPLLLPHVPGFVLKAVMGEMAAIVLGGNAVSVDKLVRTGFRFNFDKVDSALNDLFSEA